jgi:hypothetical protein
VTFGFSAMFNDGRRVSDYTESNNKITSEIASVKEYGTCRGLFRDIVTVFVCIN